jgi:hypothetical protein
LAIEQGITSLFSPHYINSKLTSVSASQKQFSQQLVAYLPLFPKLESVNGGTPSDLKKLLGATARTSLQFGTS